MSTHIQVLPKSGITIGTTPITSGVAGHVLFEGAGNVVQEDAGLTFNNGAFAVKTGASTRLSIGNDPVYKVFNLCDSVYNDGFSTYLKTPAGATPQVTCSGNGLVLTSSFVTSLSASNQIQITTNSIVRSYFDNAGFVGIGPKVSGLGARLDVQAQGALSTDIAFRVRNSADSANLLSIDGTGKLTLAFGGDTTKININGNCTGQESTAIYGTAGLRSTAVGAYTSAIYDSVAVGYNVSTGAGNGFGFGHTISGAGVSIGRDIANNNTNIAIGFSHTISGDGNCVTLLGRGMSDLSTYLETKNTHTLGFGSYGTTGNKPALTFRSNNLNQLLLGYYSTDAQYSTATGSNWLGVKTGTEPSGQTDAFQMYSADIVAGNAAPHFRTENGSIIKLYKQDLPTNPTNAQIATFLSNLGLANLI